LPSVVEACREIRKLDRTRGKLAELRSKPRGDASRLAASAEARPAPRKVATQLRKLAPSRRTEIRELI
jgi:hypothetical protein